MKAIMVMFDSLNKRMLSSYGCRDVYTPNFERLAQRCVTFDNCYIGSMPCMPARRDLHTGRYSFLHRSWGPLEPFDDSMPEILKKNRIHTHLVSDHNHYWEDGGATYHNRYTTWEANRGQEGDPWIGQVKDPDNMPKDKNSLQHRNLLLSLGLGDRSKNDTVNRLAMDTEDKMPQSRTFAGGLEFIERNHAEDNWFLQIETFDPHEPFFVSERFKAMYPDPDGYDGPDFDWPSYRKVQEPEDQKQHCINRYKALVSMCDYNLGRVLDAMDQYDLWKDTLLIVNTDHGFILGEHDWWGKSVMPHYNEVANIPFFIWNPEVGCAGERRQALVQNIDVAPTLLTWFGLEPTANMLGKDLTQTLRDDTPVHDAVLFGTHSEFINITDGRYVYMRCPDLDIQQYEYTLMPTHMKQPFSTEELRGASLSAPFSFTKEVPLLKIPCAGSFSLNADAWNTVLYDLEKDPGQHTPVEDPETELSLINRMRELMLENDAPDDAFAAAHIAKEKAFTAQDLAAEKAFRENPVLDGFEDFTYSQKVYSQCRILLHFMPADTREEYRKQFKEYLLKQNIHEITTETIISFAKTMDLPDWKEGLLMGKIMEL